jgi:hypothetical protein
LSKLIVTRATMLVTLIVALSASGCQPSATDTAPPSPKPPPSSVAVPKRVPLVERTGAIEVTASIAGAQVIVDGEARGASPRRIAGLTPGSHEVRIEAEGYEPWEGSVTVLPDVAIPLKARLLQPPARLRVESDVPGASVFLDRKFVGTTPVELDDLSIGTHALNVSAEGYDIHAQTVSLAPGNRTVRVSLKAVRLDEGLEVVHRHGLGSCRGRLTASPDAVVFASTNASHSFQVPLEQVVEIKAEYLNKNLFLKLRDGRKFNFTTGDENADALVTFEQNVSKARAKLKQNAR